MQDCYYRNPTVFTFCVWIFQYKHVSLERNNIPLFYTKEM
uniref:Uncharacterized protein n=1 Tax=Trichinella nativa TaxID=6335 RepID=A0A0V1KIT2_9BILA